MLCQGGQRAPEEPASLTVDTLRIPCIFVSDVHQRVPAGKLTTTRGETAAPLTAAHASPPILKLFVVVLQDVVSELKGTGMFVPLVGRDPSKARDSRPKQSLQEQDHRSVHAIPVSSRPYPQSDDLPAGSNRSRPAVLGSCSKSTHRAHDTPSPWVPQTEQLRSQQ